MAEYLGDTPIFQQTMNERERAEFERFKKDADKDKPDFKLTSKGIQTFLTL